MAKNLNVSLSEVKNLGEERTQFSKQKTNNEIAIKQGLSVQSLQQIEKTWWMKFKVPPCVEFSSNNSEQRRGKSGEVREIKRNSEVEKNY